MPGLELPMKPLFPVGGKALWYNLQSQDHKLFCLQNLHHTLHRELRIWTVTPQSFIRGLHATGSLRYKFHLGQMHAYNHILIIFAAKAHKMAFRKLYIHIGDLHQLWKDRPYLTHHEVSQVQADCAWCTICQNRVSLHFFKKHLTQQSKHVLFQHCASCSHGTFALVLEWTYHLIQSWIE